MRWPGGEEFVLKDIQANQLVEVGFNPAEAIQLQSFSPIYLPIITKYRNIFPLCPPDHPVGGL